MGRPPTPLGTAGEFFYSEVKGSSDKTTAYTARCKFRDTTGRTRWVKRTRSSKTAATNALREAIRDIQPYTPSATAAITRTTTVSTLLTTWLEHHRTTPMPNGLMRAPSTIQFYEAPVARLIERLGEMRLVEATTARIEAHLGVGTTGQWRAERKALRLAFTYAVRMGAVDVNPVAETTAAPGSVKEPRALTVDEVALVRARIAGWQGSSKFGPKRMPELGHIVDVMLGTGLRISDVLNLRWADVDLAGDPPTLTAAVQKARGKLLTFILPGFVVEALRAQEARGLPSEGGLVFPTRNGTVLSRRNVATRLREAIGDDELAWVSSHNFRKTAATLVEREYGVGAASKLLGHSGVAVTERHYIERSQVAPDARGALDQLAR